MLIVPPKVQMQQHIEAREGVTNHFNDLMEKILNKNSHKEVYWILGKAKVENKKGVKIVKPFLQACDEKPGLVKESFVYEVDNKRGVKTLLWVMHSDDTLSFPTLGKAIRVTDGKQTGSKILLPEDR